MNENRVHIASVDQVKRRDGLQDLRERAEKHGSSKKVQLNQDLGSKYNLRTRKIEEYDLEELPEGTNNYKDEIRALEERYANHQSIKPNEISEHVTKISV